MWQKIVHEVYGGKTPAIKVMMMVFSMRLEEGVESEVSTHWGTYFAEVLTSDKVETVLHKVKGKGDSPD
ncbi:hypothetical protein EVAR_3784_1 [Eumeta japonica]|uniref:Uncharacterized protein n=1 Tax=Eumeta variegata TaxID=151549 RepID=A0A4C1SSH4_EUMVA|nr:hypothetical protein EVAR_3784_1 [Eumeta japonica]